jgi:intein/homing endonuclease
MDNEVIEEEFADETESETEARLTTEVVLDETSETFVANLIDRLMVVCEQMSGHKFYEYQKPFARRFFESLIIDDGATITALFSRQCLDGDTLILRRDGSPVRIRDHENSWCTGIKSTKRYKIRGGAEIIATDNHPVMTPDGWIPAGLLKIGDKVSVLSGLNIEGTADPDLDLARIMGYFATDGSYCKNQSAKFTNTNEKYLTEFSEMMKRAFNIDVKRYAKGNGYDLLITTEQGNSNSFRDHLKISGWDEHFPLEVFSWTREAQAAFINRAWAGDGCISMKKSGPDIFLACGNSEVNARYWQSLLLRFGISSTVKREVMTKGTGVFHRLVVSCGSVSVRKFFDSFGLIYGKEIKSQEALDYFDAKLLLPSGKGRSERNMTEVHDYGPDGEELSYSRVVSIEDTGDREVFDVEYPGKGWFLAQGVQVKNSGKTETVANVVATAMVMMPRLAKVFPELLEKYLEGVYVGAFAPVDEQADNLFGRIEARLRSDATTKILADPEINDSLVGRGRTLTLPGCGSLVRKTTCHPRATIEGRTYHVILVDECQFADSYVINKCVSEGTTILTPSGWLPIEDVVTHHLPVIQYDDNYNPAPTDLLDAMDNGVQDVWKIKTASGRELEATREHRWLVRDRAGNRKPKIKITSELSTGDTLPVSLTSNFFGSRGSYEEGYIIGQLTGDGSYIKQVMWCGFDDAAADKLKHFMTCLESELVLYHKNDNGLAEYYARGKSIRNLLRKEKLWGRKGIEKYLQFEYSKDFYRGFIEGITDSDGCVSGKEIKISGISERLIKQLQNIFVRFGIQSRVSVREQTSGFRGKLLWEVSIKSKDAVVQFRKLFTLSANKMNGTPKDTALTEIADYHSRKSSRRQTHDTKRNYPDNICWDRIVSMKYAGRKKTYCVSVANEKVNWSGIIGLNSVAPMGASTNATTVFTGTPTYNKNVFYNSIQTNKRNATKTGYRINHFEIDWRSAARENPQYKKYIAKEMLRLGEDSDEFKLSYRIKWLLDKGMFTTSERLDELGDKSMQSVVHAYNMTPVVVGIDCGRKQDRTVVTVVYVDWNNPDPFGFYHHHVLNWLDLEGQDWEEQYFRIQEFLSNYNVWKIGIDVGGLGDVVAQRMRILLPYADIVELGSAQTEQSVRWKHLKQLLERGQISWPAGAKVRRLKVYKRFRQEMEDLEIMFKGPNMIAEAPHETDAHDDYPDSLSMACVLTNLEDEQVDEVEVYSNVLYERNKY